MGAEPGGGDRWGAHPEGAQPPRRGSSAPPKTGATHRPKGGSEGEGRREKRTILSRYRSFFSPPRPPRTARQSRKNEARNAEAPERYVLRARARCAAGEGVMMMIVIIIMMMIIIMMILMM